MHLFSIDDSGSIPPADKINQTHFVLGGLSIPEEQWHNLESDFSSICRKFAVTGEVKWRFFGQKSGREDRENTLLHLTLSERDGFRRNLLTSVTKYPSVKIIVAVAHLPTIYTEQGITTPEDVYFYIYEQLTDRFQDHLQELSLRTGSKINGIIIGDHRNPGQDRNLRNLHKDLLRADGVRKSKYENLIENLFLAPSHLSIGIQFADLISGAVFRCFEHGDERWYNVIKSGLLANALGEVDNYGLVKIPLIWKENDAESRESLEPALMTQSQRTFHSS